MFALLLRKLLFVDLFRRLLLLILLSWLQIDRSESTATNLGGKSSKKRAAMSTDRGRQLNVARTSALRDRRRKEVVSVLRPQGMENKESKVEHLVKARKVKNGAVFSLVWESSDVVAYV